MKKDGTYITDSVKNGGLHSQVNYRKAKAMLLTHPYVNGRLYHLVLTGSEDRDDYRWAIDRLCRELRANGMPVMWKAAYERDEKKRFHAHYFLLIESHHKIPCQWIRYRKGEFLESLMAEKKLGFTIAPPGKEVHHYRGKQQNYAHVPKKASPRLDDAVVWISYLFKARSKTEVEGQIYTSSTNRGSVKVRPAKKAKVAAETH